MQAIVSLSSRLRNSCNNPDASKNFSGLVWSVKFMNAGWQVRSRCCRAAISLLPSLCQAAAITQFRSDVTLRRSPSPTFYRPFNFRWPHETAAAQPACSRMLHRCWIQPDSCGGSFLTFSSLVITMNCSNQFRKDVHLFFFFSQKLTVYSFSLLTFSMVQLALL